MSGQQLRRLAMILVVVLVLWAAAALASRAGKRSETGAFLPKIDTATVDTVIAVKAGDTAVVARAGKGGWRVNGHPVDTSAVREVLQALADTAASSELVAQRATSHEKLGVNADSGRKVRVVGRGGQVMADFIVGKPTAQQGGVYVRRANEPQVYALHGRLSNALPRSGEDFRDHRVAAVPEDSVATIEVQRGTRPYTLTRGANGWTFASGAAADSGAVETLLSTYGSIRAAGFATPSQEDSLHFDTPKWRTRLLKRNGETLVSFVFDSITSGVWVRHDSGGPAYRLDSWAARQLVPADSGFRKSGKQ